MNQYVSFYLNGRDDVAEGNVAAVIDLQVIAKAVLKGADLRAQVHAAVTTALAPLRTADFEEFCESNSKDIKGVSKKGQLITETQAACFGAYMQGRIDELAHVIEPDTIEAMDELLDSDWEDDDDNNEPEEDDDE